MEEIRRLQEEFARAQSTGPSAKLTERNVRIARKTAGVLIFHAHLFVCFVSVTDC